MKILSRVNAKKNSKTLKDVKLYFYWLFSNGIMAVKWLRPLFFLYVNESLTKTTPLFSDYFVVVVVKPFVSYFHIKNLLLVKTNFV